MTPQVGIDPALMTQLINGMRRTAQTLPEVAVHIERNLSALGLHMWGPSHLHTVARRLADQLPALQGRLDLILATPDRTLGKDGLLWADESAWLSKSPPKAPPTPSFSPPASAPSSPPTPSPRKQSPPWNATKTTRTSPWPSPR
ncbi:hypothetical protein ACFQES_05955 [Nonomuraea salmonea]|uniref:hypothetical protein n=1 Tax=Nonomuraea salmonea TaxID=46181 RepID=UPI0036201B10